MTQRVMPGMLNLPHDALREILVRLEARDLAAVACASRRLSQLAVEDSFWQALLLARLPLLAALLDAAPAPQQPRWWAGRSWRQRLRALAQGHVFRAQVYNRELDNEAEDFLLSAYDAVCSLTPASQRSLLGSGPSMPTAPSSSSNSNSSCCSNSGGSGPTAVGGSSGTTDSGSGSSGGSGSGGGGGSTQQQHELLFTARYLPMGAMKAVQEEGVAAQRLRLPPLGSRPHDVFSGVGSGSDASSAGLNVGDEVEVQWKGRRSHPFGWWFGTMQSVQGNRIALLFRQYPRSSVWHRVRAPIKPGREVVVNGDCSFGYVGGLRRLTAGEREEWRRHGAPHPPAPALLQALAEEVAEEDEDEEEWDELDIDVDLAAELEDDLEDLPAGNDDLAGGLAVDAAFGAAAVGAAGAGAGEADAAEAEEAAPAPAAPPGEPIAMQLGQAAAAAAAANAGTPVALAGLGLAPAGSPAGDAAVGPAAAEH